MQFVLSVAVGDSMRESHHLLKRSLLLCTEYTNMKHDEGARRKMDQFGASGREDNEQGNYPWNKACWNV